MCHIWLKSKLIYICQNGNKPFFFVSSSFLNRWGKNKTSSLLVAGQDLKKFVDKSIKLVQRSGENRRLIVFKGKSIWTLHFALLDLYLLVYNHFIPVSVKNLLRLCPFIRIITNDSLYLTTFRSLTWLSVQSRAAVLTPRLRRSFQTGSLWRTWRTWTGPSIVFLHLNMWPKSRQTCLRHTCLTTASYSGIKDLRWEQISKNSPYSVAKCWRWQTGSTRWVGRAMCPRSSVTH